MLVDFIVNFCADFGIIFLASLLFFLNLVQKHRLDGFIGVHELFLIRFQSFLLRLKVLLHFDNRIAQEFELSFILLFLFDNFLFEIFKFELVNLWFDLIEWKEKGLRKFLLGYSVALTRVFPVIDWVFVCLGRCTYPKVRFGFDRGNSGVRFTLIRFIFKSVIWLALFYNKIYHFLATYAQIPTKLLQKWLLLLNLAEKLDSYACLRLF